MLLKRVGTSEHPVEHSVVRTAVLLLGVLLWPIAVSAESFAIGDVLEDTKLYFTAPLHWDSQDWLYFGAALTAIGAAHEFDGRMRTQVRTLFVVPDAENRKLFYGVNFEFSWNTAHWDQRRNSGNPAHPRLAPKSTTILLRCTDSILPRVSSINYLGLLTLRASPGPSRAGQVWA